MFIRPAACAGLLLASSCHEERAPERLAAQYASSPRDHYDDLSRASQRALELVFDTENLPEVPGAVCRPAETRADRLRFICANSEGQSRPVLLLREDGAWRVAETSRAYRLLRKAPLEIDAYAAALHGAAIDPEEELFAPPVARHLLRNVLAAKLAAERLAKAKPFADRVLARTDLAPKDRAELLIGRAVLQFTAARGASEAEAQRLLDGSRADATEAARLDPALAEKRAHLEYGRSVFRRMSDLQWLAGELRRIREKYLSAAGDEKRQRALHRLAREIGDILIRENGRRAEEWQAELASASGATIRLRVPSGADFAISLGSGQGDSDIVEAARALQPGACVVFSGAVDPREQGRSEAETMREPTFLVDFEQLEPCLAQTAQR